MAFTTHTLTGDVSDVIGNDFDPTHVTIALKPSTPVISDNLTKTRWGRSPLMVQPAADGTFTIPNVPTSADGGPLWALTIRVGDPNSRNAAPSATIQWFEMLGDDDLARIVRRTVEPLLITPAVAANIAAAVQHALAAQGFAADAEASAAEAADISGIAVSDDVVGALVKGAGGAGPKTRAELAATIAAAAEQTDYIAMAERFSPYTAIELRKVPTPYAGDPCLEVSCVAPDGRHVTYEITNNTGGPGSYRIVSRIWEGTTTPTYLPAGATALTTDNGDYDWRASQAVRSGSFNTTSTYYATAAGATFDSPAPVTVVGGSMKVSWHSFTDNRGGLWRLSVVGKPEFGTKDVSVWTSASVLTLQADIWTINNVPAGDYTIRATFIGDDPAHVPSSGAGTGRGWVGSTDGSGQYAIRVSDLVQARDRTNAVKAIYSNPDIAIRMRPAAGGTYRYFPHHNEGQATDVKVSTAFYDGTSVIDVDALGIGETLQLKNGFEMVQNYKGRNTTGGADLVTVWSKQRITRNGVNRCDLSVKVVADIQVGTDTYAIMHVINPSIFDRLVSSWANAYAIDKTSNPDATITNLDVEKNKAISWAAISAASPDLFAAARFNNLTQTLRSLKSVNDHPLWVEHRSATVTKLYPSLGYAPDTIVPAGTVWRISGDFFYGRIPAVAGVVAP